MFYFRLEMYGRYPSEEEASKLKVVIGVPVWLTIEKDKIPENIRPYLSDMR